MLPGITLCGRYDATFTGSIDGFILGNPFTIGKVKICSRSLMVDTKWLQGLTELIYNDMNGEDRRGRGDGKRSKTVLAWMRGPRRSERK